MKTKVVIPRVVETAARGFGYFSKRGLMRTAFVLSAMVAGQPVFAVESCQKPLAPLLSGVVNLPQGCIYERPIAIIASNTALDCNGSVFDGKGQDKIGLYIDSRGEPLENVVVRNCTFRNFKGGVRIAWKQIDAEKGGDKAEIYRRSPRKIVLDNLNVEDNHGVGIYVDDYSTEVSINNSIIRNNRAVGIYLEHSSRKNKITNNRFVGNGFGDGRREAIAVDSSAENIIENNYFEANAAGGVFLYKNCGEHIDSGRQVVRWQHSTNNRISNNRFVNENVGVWLASRQSKDLKRIGCSDKSMDAGGHFFEDYANDNFIVRNEFIKNKVGIRVEGDRNRIDGNKFECAGRVSIDIPRTKREEFLNRPQVGNVVKANNESGCRK